MAPYCAIPRDYLSDTPLLRAMGFLVSQDGKLGAIPPPPFLSVSPLESMRSGGAIPPHKRGISAILARYPVKTSKTRAIPPSAILSRKGIARYGGVSRTGPLSPHFRTSFFSSFENSPDTYFWAIFGGFFSCCCKGCLVLWLKRAVTSQRLLGGGQPPSTGQDTIAVKVQIVL